MKFKCVIFDFDKTLFNLYDSTNWESARKLVEKTYLENGIAKKIVEKHNYGPFELFFGVYREICKSYPRPLLLKIQSDVSKCIEKFEIEGASHAQPIGGCKEVLEHLYTKGVTIAIISTNSEASIRKALSRFNLEKFIIIVKGRRPLSEENKPNPIQIIECFRELDCKPKEAVIVGDGIEDMMVARRVKVLAIGLATEQASENALKRAGAKLVVKNLKELISYIDKLD